MIGIYKITNPLGKIYIGQSINIEKRFTSYNNLNCKKQRRLYNSFLKYGVENHLFEIIEICDIKDLNIKERKYQLIYDTISISGLNCKLTNENDSNGIYCESTKTKMSESAKVKVFTDAHRQNMSKNRIGDKNGMFGKKQSQEAKNKMSKAKENMSDEVIKKYSDYAKNRSQEHRQKLSESHKGKVPANSKIILNIETGIYYNSITEASKTFHKGQGSRTLSCKLLGKRKNNTNFIYA
jgi:group I intron endonuclease